METHTNPIWTAESQKRPSASPSTTSVTRREGEAGDEEGGDRRTSKQVKVCRSHDFFSLSLPLLPSHPPLSHGFSRDAFPPFLSLCMPQWKLLPTLCLLNSVTWDQCYWGNGTSAKGICVELVQIPHPSIRWKSKFHVGRQEGYRDYSSDDSNKQGFTVRETIAWKPKNVRQGKIREMTTLPYSLKETENFRVEHFWGNARFGGIKMTRSQSCQRTKTGLKVWLTWGVAR